jgi:hypothetical protein
LGEVLSGRAGKMRPADSSKLVVTHAIVFVEGELLGPLRVTAANERV